LVSQPKILVVDDDRGLVDMRALALEDAGFLVERAHDGKAGWARFLAVAADLVRLGAAARNLRYKPIPQGASRPGGQRRYPRASCAWAAAAAPSWASRGRHGRPDASQCVPYVGYRSTS